MRKIILVVITIIIAGSFLPMANSSERKMNLIVKEEEKPKIDSFIYLSKTNKDLFNRSDEFGVLGYWEKAQYYIEEKQNEDIYYFPIIDSIVFNSKTIYLPFPIEKILIYYAAEDKTFHASLSCPVFNEGSRHCYYLEEVAPKVLKERYCSLCSKKCGIFIPASKEIIRRSRK